MKADMKRCSKCQVEKLLDEFPKRSNRPSGVYSWCKECVSAKNRAYHASNVEGILVEKAAYRKVHAERIKVEAAEYRNNNRDSLNQYFRDYAKRNPQKKQAASSARRARKLQATPAFANQSYVAMFYELARLESKRLGIDVHVDHIVPLKSSLVCGLHNEHNLQLLVASANLTKSNRVWPHMP